MLKIYLKLAYRNILRSKLFSLINVFGLSIGIAACLLIIQYVSFEKSYESFHKNADHIYRVTLDLYNGSEYVVTDCETYAVVGPQLKDEFPEVTNFVRFLHFDQQEVKVDNKVFLENGIYFADSSAFDVFTYQMLQGDPSTALSLPYKIAITRSIATKYYGSTDAIGKSMKVGNEYYEVTAVIEDLPPNTHLKFNILLSHTTINSIWSWYKENEWNSNNEYTYLLMAPGTNLEHFNQKLNLWCVGLGDKLEDEMLVAEPINDIHLYSNKTFEPEVNGDARIVNFLTVIALIIMLIAWVNYANLSIVRSMESAREVGVRKVIGSFRIQLILQFLFNAAIISLIAILLAIPIIFISLPAFIQIANLPFSYQYIFDPYIWLFLVGSLFLGTLVAGFYPAFIMSSFKPTVVLKGKIIHSIKGSLVGKSMVIFQFSATIILLICTATIFMQIQHLRKVDLGMKLEQVVGIKAHVKGESYKEELLRIPSVNIVSNVESLPGQSLHDLSTTSGIKRFGNSYPGNGYNFYVVRVDEFFLKTMDIQLIAGRNFQQNAKGQVLVNEEAIRLLGFDSIDEAIGSKITYYSNNGQPSTIIGAIKNYHHRSPKESHLPMIFPYTNTGNFYAVNLNTNDIRKTIQTIEKAWYSHYPDNAFSYFFLDSQYEHQYQTDESFGKVVGTFSMLAIFIACLGLFGLASYTAQKRMKEIGVRKVNGAKVIEILTLLNKNFVKWVVIAFVIATPIAWYSLSKWLENFAYKTELSWWVFALAGLLALGIALLTVSWQSWKAATKNPVEALRYE